MKQNIGRFKNCFGCGVCSISCPVDAISIARSKDGFYEPIVDFNACVECGFCLAVCSHNNTEQYINEFSPTGYAVWSKDKLSRRKCTSGGFVYELLKEYVANHGYKAIVVRYNAKDNIAEHYVAESVEQLNESMGSKYIQSKTIDAFKQINNNDFYIIVGTPCQISSLRRYIRLKNIEGNFILVDFFCHGVPSLNLWSKYTETIEKKTGKLTDAIWRNKYTGKTCFYSTDKIPLETYYLDASDNDFDWQTSTNLILKGRKGIYNSRYTTNDLFFKFFLHDRCLNYCCYKYCRFKLLNSEADIRVCDLWGRTYMNHNQGVNGVICFTEKGQLAFNHIENNLEVERITPGLVYESQMKNNPSIPKSYNYVKYALKTKATIKLIDRIATLIEMPDYMPTILRYYKKQILKKLLKH